MCITEGFVLVAVRTSEDSALYHRGQLDQSEILRKAENTVKAQFQIHLKQHI